MSMFGKETAGSLHAVERRGLVAEAPMSLISSGMTITGDLSCSGVVRIDGQIAGSVTGARQVLLGKEALVHGNVIADEIVIGGTVEGMVVAAKRLELQETAVVNGDIESSSIIVMEGARINGTLRMGDSAFDGSAGSPDALRTATAR